MRAQVFNFIFMVWDSNACLPNGCTYVATTDTSLLFCCRICQPFHTFEIIQSKGVQLSVQFMVQKTSKEAEESSLVPWKHSVLQFLITGTKVFLAGGHREIKKKLCTQHYVGSHEACQGSHACLDDYRLTGWEADGDFWPLPLRLFLLQSLWLLRNYGCS